MRRIFVLILILFSLTGCKDVTNKVNEIIQSARGELQSKRAVTISEETLDQLDRLDIALAIDKETLAESTHWILDELNGSEKVKEESIEFRDLTVSLGDQRISVDVIATKPVEGLMVTARIQMSAIVGATANAIHWNLYVDGLEILQIEGLPFLSRFRSREADSVLAEMDSVLGLINVVLDEIINDDPEKAVLLTFDEKELVREQLRKSEKDGENETPDPLILDEKLLEASLETVATGVLISESGATVVAKVRFVSPEDFTERKPTFPEDSSLILQNQAGVAERIRAYQATINERVSQAFGPDFEPYQLGRRTGVLVAKPAIARLFNFLIKSGGVAGTLTIDEVQSSTSNLNFEIKRRNCTDYFAGCGYHDICAGSRCIETVSETYQDVCQVNCCLSTGLLGCLIPGLCDEACTKTREITRPISGVACDGFRAADQLHGGRLCTLASNIDKALCDIDANLNKSLCDVEQEVARFYEANPVATVKATMTPRASARIEITNASLTESLSELIVEFSARGSGSLSVGLDYDRHNYADIAVVPPEISLGLGCATDWAESIDLSVDIPEFHNNITFTLSVEEVKNGLKIAFAQKDDRVIYANFSPSPLGALFGGKPQVTLNCPLAVLSSFVAASAEAVFTKEDARTVLPLLTGENYPQKIQNATFDIILEPLPICSSVKHDEQIDTDECVNPLATLHASMGQRSIVYSIEN